MNINGTYKVIATTVLVILAISSRQYAAQKDGLLHVNFLDVGQGDAIFIQTPNGNQVLIDGGPDASVLRSLGRLMPLWDKSIDVVVLSHPHSDHLAGLNDVLDRYDVAAVIRADVIYESAVFSRWLDILNNEGAKVIDAKVGRALDLGSGVTLTIIHPENISDEKPTKFPNEDSVVAMLEYKDSRFIFTGDLESRTEKKMLALGVDIDADVLKVPHHGSKTGLEDDFLNAVSPAVAVISVGAKNKYGHPAPIIIEKLEKNAIPYYRTDESGDIHFATDGEKILITKQK